MKRVFLLLAFLLWLPDLRAQQINRTMEMMPGTASIGPQDIFLVTTGMVGNARSTRGINESNLLENLAILSRWAALVANNSGSNAPIITLAVPGAFTPFGSPLTNSGTIGFSATHFPGFLLNDGNGGLSWSFNGSNLFSLNAGALSYGTLAAARLPALVTLQGNLFNSASELVQLDASARLPAVDGSELFNLNASDLSSGTVLAAQMPGLTGDVTSSAGSVATTIGPGAVTYTKIQNASQTQVVLGRNSAGAGVYQEVGASAELDWLSSTRGGLLERGASGWNPILPGTSGQAFLSGGAGADPGYGLLSLAAMANLAANSVIGNNTGSPAAPGALTPSQVMDIIGSTRGSILERGASGWTLITPGTSGQAWLSGGAGADPGYGLLSLAAMANLPGNTVIGNSSGSPAVPAALTSLPESFITGLPADLSARILVNAGSGSNNILVGQAGVTNWQYGTHQRVNADGTTNGYNNVVNVEDFGLTASGDQTAVIQAAVNYAALQDNGAQVVLPARQITITGTVYVTNSNVIISGQAAGGSSSSGQGTLIYVGGSAHPTFFMNSSSVSHIEFHNLQFLTDSGTVGGTALCFSNNQVAFPGDVLIESCSFKNYNYGVYLFFVGQVTMVNDYFLADVYGVFGTNQANAVKIYGGHFSANQNAIVIKAGCYDWDIASTFDSCSNGVYVIGGSGVNNVHVHDSHFESSTTNEVVGSGVYNFEVNNCFFGSMVGTNVTFVNCVNPALEHCFFDNSAADYNVDSATTGFYFVQGYSQQPNTRKNASTSYSIFDGNNLSISGNQTAGGIYSSSGNLNYTSLTNLPANTVLGAGSGGGSATALTMGANMSIVAGALTSSGGGGGGTGIQTNNGTGTNNIMIGAYLGSNTVIGTFSRTNSDATTNGFYNVVNVEDFGMTASGDQSAAIQAAINYAALQDNGAKVVLPARQITLTSTIYVTNSNVIIEGQAAGGSSSSGQGTLIYIGGTTHPTFYMNSSSVSHIEFHNIQFLADSGTLGDMALCFSNNAASFPGDVLIEGCSFKNYDYGVYLNFVGQVTMINDYFLAGGYHGAVYGTNQANVVKIYGGHFSANQNAIVIKSGCYDWDIASTFDSCSNGVYVIGGSGIQNVHVHDSHFETGTTNEIVAVASYNVEVNNCTFGTMVGTNVTFVNCVNPALEHCFFDNSAADFNVDNATTGFYFVQGYSQQPNTRKNAASTYSFFDGSGQQISGASTAASFQGTVGESNLTGVTFAYGGNTGPIIVPANQTQYYAPNQSGVTNTVTSDSTGITRIVLPAPAIVVGAYVQASGNPGSVANTFKVFTNGVATGTSIAMNNVTTGNDTAHPSAICPAGTDNGVQLVTASGGTAVKWEWGVLVRLTSGF